MITTPIHVGRSPEHFSVRAGYVLTINAQDGAGRVTFRSAHNAKVGGADIQQGTALRYGPFIGQRHFDVESRIGKLVVTESEAVEPWAEMLKTITLTQAQYDALTVKDPSTLYVIPEV